MDYFPHLLPLTKGQLVQVFWSTSIQSGWVFRRKLPHCMLHWLFSAHWLTWIFWQKYDLPYYMDVCCALNLLWASQNCKDGHNHCSPSRVKMWTFDRSIISPHTLHLHIILTQPLLRLPQLWSFTEMFDFICLLSFFPLHRSLLPHPSFSIILFFLSPLFILVLLFFSSVTSHCCAAFLYFLPCLSSAPLLFFFCCFPPLVLLSTKNKTSTPTDSSSGV